MKTLYGAVLTLLFLMFSPQEMEAKNLEFHDLLEEAKLSLTLPDSYKTVEVKKNDILSYEYAKLHQNKALEIRYMIRPISRIQIEYDDPHNAAPEPNHLFPLLFETVMNVLSVGHTPNQVYPPEQAKEMFNADWASAAVFDVNPKFNTAFSQALLLGLHKDNRADVYTIFLFNDYQSVKSELDAHLASLSFL